VGEIAQLVLKLMSTIARGLRLVILLCIVIFTFCQDPEEDGKDKSKFLAKEDAKDAGGSQGKEDSKGNDKDDPKELDEDRSEREFSDDELRQVHKVVDENNDQKLSQEELLKFTEQQHRKVELAGNFLEEEFERIDSDKDGSIALKEYLNDTVYTDPTNKEDLSQQETDETKMFQAADANHDGILDKTELAGLISPEANGAVMDVAVSQSMKSADANSDGKLTFDEFEAADLTHHERAPAGDDDDDDNDSEAATNSADFAKKMFKRLDVNGDGVLEESELRDLHSGKLQREQLVDDFVKTVDKDNDLKIDQDELLQGKSAFQDSDIQDYLIAWAQRRPVIGR
jgi:Ca2+-binding EF-hand superfamily protein